MSKFDKPAYLRKSQPAVVSEQSTASDDYFDQYAEENLRLKQTLREFIDSANHNQQTQEKFYELELYFLESDSYESLLKRILVDLKQKLRLTQVELILIDPAQEIRQLIVEIYGDIDYPNLFYNDSVEIINDIYSDPVRITLSQKPTLINKLFFDTQKKSQSVALLPLTRGAQVIGSLHLGSQDKNRFHSGLASSFLQHLGSVISVCIENSLNQERFKHLSLVDLLTRARNRRYFFQVLAREIARSSRSQRPLSCLFIDIDHFKQVNDIRGHLVGDRALRTVAKTIQPLLRQSDVLARFGGEEFTVLLPDSELKQAAIIAERIRTKVETTAIKDDKNQSFQVTVSIGVSNWQPASAERCNNPDIIQNYLIQQADKGVYKAKEDGRNCVRVVTTTNTV